MNYYRLLMVLMGCGIAVPNVIFLLKFRPPKEDMRVLSLGLKIKASALLVGGLRIVWLYAITPEAGASINTFEKTVSVVASAYVAVAANLFLFGYLWYRKGGRGSIVA